MTLSLEVISGEGRKEPVQVAAASNPGSVAPRGHGEPVEGDSIDENQEVAHQRRFRDGGREKLTCTVRKWCSLIVSWYLFHSFLNRL